MGEFILQTATALHETGENFEILPAINLDLFAIKKSGTDTHSTEVAVLTAKSKYQAFGLQTGTPLHETGANYQFLLASNGDLFAIKKNGTGTGSTEVAVLTAKSKYQAFSLQTGTPLHETNETFQFTLAENRDLVGIKKSGTGTGTTELCVLSAKSNYQSFTLQTGTALHETGNNFEFSVVTNRDLFAVKKNATGTGSTEVAVLLAKSNYQQFGLQTGTALHETDHTFTFSITPDRNLFCVKKSNTGSVSTEVHILKLSEERR